MELSSVAARVKRLEAAIEVVGDEKGDLFLIVKQGEHRNFVTNKGNGRIKRFREPRTLTKYLKVKGIRRYSIHLLEWDLTQIFDRHKAAMMLRAR